MGMYAKLFSSLYQGTLRGNSHGILVFTNLLAHCDQHGFADIHPRAIADEVGLTLAEVNAALAVLEAPETESRSSEEGGRRIVKMDDHRAWGWRVVNYLKYRAIRNEDDRREQNRLAQERFRNKQSKPTSANRQQDKPIEKEKEIQKKKNSKSAATASPTRGSRIDADWKLPLEWGVWAMKTFPHWDRHIVLSVSETFADHWRSQAGSKGVKLDWQATWRNWCRSDITQRAHPPSKPSADVAATARELTAQADHAAQAVPPPASVRSALSVLSKMRVNR